MKKSNINIEDILGKALLMAFLLGFLIVLNEADADAKDIIPYETVVDIDQIQSSHTELAPVSKLPSFNPTLTPVGDSQFNYHHRFVQIQVIADNFQNVQLKDLMKKFASFKSGLFIDLIKSSHLARYDENSSSVS